MLHFGLELGFSTPHAIILKYIMACESVKTSMQTLNQVEYLADRYGLVVRGAFTVQDEDNVPPIHDHSPSRTLMLFGNVGSSIWKAFYSSEEYGDGRPDALDRWSRRIGEKLASQLEGRALFPFGGPPYHPFLNWARKAESLVNSRLGMLIHPKYGLWHAYRFAIALPVDIEISPGNPIDICAACPAQPCIAACPVNAFEAEMEFDARACDTHLSEQQDTACRNGCRARLSCPYASEFKYHPDQTGFHMDAYVKNMSKRF